MPDPRAIRETLVEASRRYSRVPHEVEDLAHDVIASALRRGLPIDSPVFLRSLHGAARRHGAFLARSAGRRRSREEISADRGDVVGIDASAGTGLAEGAPLSVLPPALKTTLLLLLLGLEKGELRYVLGVNDAALRKRFQALRERGPLARPAPNEEQASPNAGWLRRSQIGMLPRLPAGASDPAQARVLAVSDPDGHGLILTEMFTPKGRAATSEVPAPNQRAPTKGRSC